MGVPDLEKIPLAFSFPQINDHAFPKERVEQIFEKLGKSWLFHDIPGQEAVIQVDQSGIIPCGTHQAFQPPVGGVKAVGMMGGPGLCTFALQ